MSEPAETPDEAAFECDLCEKRFDTRDELRDHIWAYHELDGDITTDIQE